MPIGREEEKHIQPEIKDSNMKETKFWHDVEKLVESKEEKFI